MAKMTKVFGAILCVLGTVYLIVSIFLTLNTSSVLDYNTGKLQTLSQSGVFYYLMIAVLILGFGIIFAKDKVLNNDHH
jgi:predicted transporter